jgi:hypothetical protein
MERRARSYLDFGISGVTAALEDYKYLRDRFF